MTNNVRRLTPQLLCFLAFAACASTSAPTQQRKTTPAGTPAGVVQCPWGPLHMRGWPDTGMPHMFTDATTKVTLEGTIQQVIGDNLKLYMPHVILVVSKSTTPPAEFVIHTGPSWYFEQQGFKVKTAAKIRVDGRTLDSEPQTVIASSLKIDGKTLTLRDERGYPVWAGGLRQGAGAQSSGRK